MNDAEPSGPLVELQVALTEAVAEPPPPELRSIVEASAFRARPPGQSLLNVPPISPLEAFRRAVTSVRELLDDLAQAEWLRPARSYPSVQALIGHLTGVEHDFAEGLDTATASPAVEESAGGDHVRSTRPFAMRQQGRPPNETRSEWGAHTARTLGLLEGPDGTDLARSVHLHGLSFPLGTWLVIRSFELWTHEEDVRRATGRPVKPPTPASLQLMTGLVFELLPSAMAAIGRPVGDDRIARVVLTGQGGGTWTVPATSGTRNNPGVRIVADAVRFCRLAANRVSSTDVEPVVSGSETLADDVLRGTASLALD